MKLVLSPVLQRSVVTLVHLNTDLWTSKVSHQKILGVRIFWKSGPEMKTAFLVVTLYTSPKQEVNQESEWLFEYVLVVLKWYGVEPKHVKGATSDAGSDCKKAFNKLAQEYGWMCLVFSTLDVLCLGGMLGHSIGSQENIKPRGQAPH